MKRFVRNLVDFVKRNLFIYIFQKKQQDSQRILFNCDDELPDNLILKIADTQQEIEECLALLHDSYVGSGFMIPDPSGLRVTVFHALPTTTTLCAKIDDKVVGTLSLIRDGPFGFPLQKIFDLREMREKGGVIAEASALAVHRTFRRHGGTILFPLMKFMREYCVTYFDVRHLVIAVNPRHIHMYESVLFFKRLQEQPVENYDYVNGAPAVGATLDLQEAFAETGIYRKTYGSRPSSKNLHRYFLQRNLPNIQLPARRFFTTNDPVMTPEMLDYFFNIRTSHFKGLNDHDRARLHMIYDLPEYHAVLPDFSQRASESRLRHHARFSFKCPGRFSYATPKSKRVEVSVEVVEISRFGFVAQAASQLVVDVWGEVEIRFGVHEISRSSSCVVRDLGQRLYAFHVETPDMIWRKFMGAISKGSTKNDLDNATQFLNL
jgi:hypothetical protein